MSFWAHLSFKQNYIMTDEIRNEGETPEVDETTEGTSTPAEGAPVTPGTDESAE